MFKKTIAAGLACTLPFFYACSSDDEGPEQEAGSLSANTTAIQAGDDCGTNGGTLIELVDEEGETVAKIPVCNGGAGVIGLGGDEGPSGSNGSIGADGLVGQDGAQGGQGGQGEPGVDGNTVQLQPIEPAEGAACGLSGGTEVTVLQPDGTVVSTQAICNGSSVSTSDSELCGELGGVHFEVLDPEGNVLGESDVCNGAPGADAWTCAVNLYGDGFCDEGCGITDLDCRAAQDLYVAPFAETEEEFLANSPSTEDAANVNLIFSFPQAVWFTDLEGGDLTDKVTETVSDAVFKNQLPVLVAYNLPYRDCAQYSAGGATTADAYKAWIDAFAAGLGNHSAMVILEPDGLGIIPHNTTIYGAEDWCKPTVDDVDDNGDPIQVPAPFASPEVRYELLNYAVDRLSAAGAAVYLDGTHASWLGVSEAAYRLNKAGVGRARGFFLNVSNYQTTENSLQFGEWVSACITAATEGASWARGHFDWCPGQYNAALNYAVDYSPAYAATVNAGLAGMMDGHPATTHYLVDTSRNGTGPMDASVYGEAPYLQESSVVSSLGGGAWCNPRGRGLGLRPSLKPEADLLDAYLWVKIPGESDGSCDIAGGARAWDFDVYSDDNWVIADETHFDPLWGMVDPVAGAWFKEQAAELIELAVPALD